MNSDWQAIVSEAAVQTFLRRGDLPVFRLARSDLWALAEQAAGQPGLVRKLEAAPVPVALECRIWCAQLGRFVTVREWEAGP